VVLEKEIIFIGCATDSSKNITLHEILDITAKAIDYLAILNINLDIG